MVWPLNLVWLRVEMTELICLKLLLCVSMYRKINLHLQVISKTGLKEVMLQQGNPQRRVKQAHHKRWKYQADWRVLFSLSADGPTIHNREEVKMNACIVQCRTLCYIVSIPVSIQSLLLILVLSWEYVGHWLTARAYIFYLFHCILHFNDLCKLRDCLCHFPSCSSKTLIVLVLADHSERSSPSQLCN